MNMCYYVSETITLHPLDPPNYIFLVSPFFNHKREPSWHQTRRYQLSEFKLPTEGREPRSHHMQEMSETKLPPEGREDIAPITLDARD